MMGGPLLRALDRVSVVFLILMAAVAILIPVFNLMVPPESPKLTRTPGSTTTRMAASSFRAMAS